MGTAESQDQRDETLAERDDRNLAELLQELRVAGLGVQVLTGFLLSLPFTNRFSRLSQVSVSCTWPLSCWPRSPRRSCSDRSLSSPGVPPRPEGAPRAGGQRDGDRRHDHRRPGRIGRGLAGHRLRRQPSARGAGHRVRHLHVRRPVVRAAARAPARKGGVSRNSGLGLLLTWPRTPFRQQIRSTTRPPWTGSTCCAPRSRPARWTAPP
jgi:Family of unknown function (DUF6328)